MSKTKLHPQNSKFLFGLPKWESKIENSSNDLAKLLCFVVQLNIVTSIGAGNSRKRTLNKHLKLWYMNINLKLFTRLIAGVSYTGIYTHTAVTVDELFGLNVNTTIFLITLLGFYIASYLYKFQNDVFKDDLAKLHLLELDLEKMTKCLLLSNLLLILYNTYLISGDPISIKNIISTVFEFGFIAFPELLINIICKIFKS